MIRLLSALISSFLIIIFYTAFILATNSIVLSHYGGLSAIFSSYILSAILCLTFGIAIAARYLIRLVQSPSKILSTCYIICISMLICFVYFNILLYSIDLSFNYSVLNPFSSILYYVFVLATIIQILFLKKKLPKKEISITVKKALIGVGVFIISISIFWIIVNISQFIETNKFKENQPEYMRGSSKTYRIVISEECGETPIYEYGKLVVVFPENGIVILNIEDKDFYPSMCKFYIINENGEKEYCYLTEEWFEYSDEDKIMESKGIKGIACTGHKYILGVDPDGGFSSSAPTAIEYWDFFGSAPAYDKDENEDFDERTKTLVEKCRRKGK